MSKMPDTMQGVVDVLVQGIKEAADIPTIEGEFRDRGSPEIERLALPPNLSFGSDQSRPVSAAGRFRRLSARFAAEAMLARAAAEDLKDLSKQNDDPCSQLSKLMMDVGELCEGCDEITSTGDTRQHVLEYISKSVEDLIQLKGTLKNKQNTHLKELPENTVKRLLELSNPILHVGLISEADANVLRLVLWHAAGQPTGDFGDCNREFEEEDRSTWTLTALKKCDIVQLAGLQCHTNQRYQCPVNQFLNVLPLDAHTCNNVFPLEEAFFALDKSALTDPCQCMKFRLRSSVFDCGTKYTPLKSLRALREKLQQICNPQQMSEDITDTDFEFSSSPLHAVTLPDASRAKASIPKEAAYYSFCYPLVEDLNHLTEMMRKDICWDDPFISWIMMGAFVYFDYQFDLVAINAVSLGEMKKVPKKPTSVCLGASSPLPTTSVRTLQEWRRWKPVTSVSLKSLGFTHFAWIVPSEFIGNYIFPKSGGFAYLHKDDRLLQEPVQQAEGDTSQKEGKTSKQSALARHSGNESRVPGRGQTTPSPEASSKAATFLAMKAEDREGYDDSDSDSDVSSTSTSDKADEVGRVKTINREVNLMTEQRSRFFPVVQDAMMIDGMKPGKNGGFLKLNKDQELGEILDEDPHQGVQIVQKLVAARFQKTPKPLIYDTPLHVDALYHALKAESAQPRKVSEDKFVTVNTQMATFSPGQTAARGLPTALGYKSESDVFAKVAEKLSVHRNEYANEDKFHLEVMYQESQRVDAKAIRELVQRSGVWLRKDEEPERYAAEVRDNADYVIKSAAKVCSADASQNAKARRAAADPGLERYDACCIVFTTLLCRVPRGAQMEGNAAGHKAERCYWRRVSQNMDAPSHFRALPTLGGRLAPLQLGPFT